MPKTDENKTLNNKIRKLAPDAIEAMGDMLRDPHTPAPTKAQIIGFILERTLGKPDTTIHLMTAGSTIKDSENRLIALAEEIRETENNSAIAVTKEASSFDSCSMGVISRAEARMTPQQFKNSELLCDEDAKEENVGIDNIWNEDVEGEMNGYPEE